jgi:hypothetical protein
MNREIPHGAGRPPGAVSAALRYKGIAAPLPQPAGVSVVSLRSHLPPALPGDSIRSQRVRSPVRSAPMAWSVGALVLALLAWQGHLEWVTEGILLVLGFGVCLWLALRITRRAWAAIHLAERGPCGPAGAGANAP